MASLHPNEDSGNATDDAPDASGRDWALYFGGPDKPARRLRDLLAQQIDRQPAGARIHFASYYFRDVDLAKRLIAASDRGVTVHLVLEGLPRRRSANDDVIALLESHGLGGGLHLRTARSALTRKLRGYLHTKIYAFSHPTPCALIGSFNPSGNDPEDADVIAEIGDQDRGHNLLLRLDEDVLVEGLVQQVQWLGQRGDSPGRRFSPWQNRRLRGTLGEIFFYPRLMPSVLPRALKSLPGDTRLYGAISHLKARGLGHHLEVLGARGMDISLLVHDTERRVPEALVQSLNASGAATTRYCHPEALPMHAKFILTRARKQTTSWLGSYNHNPRSAWLNDEILFRARDEALFDALLSRFDQIQAEAHRFAALDPNG